MIGAPVMLVDAGVVPAGGGSWSPDLEKMQSLTKDNIVVEEMRLWVRATFTTTATALAGAWPMALIACDLQAGRHAMTNGYVGMAALGPTEERFGQAEFTSPNSALAADNANTMRWRFPRGMALAAGTPMRPTFRWQDPLGNRNGSTNVSVTVAFCGRTIDQMPEKTFVPYASDYTARVNNSDSADLDLMNVCQRPLNVSGLGIGLYSAINPSATPGDLWACDQLYGERAWGGLFDGGGGSYRASGQVKIVDQDEFAIVPQYTSLSQIGGARLWLPTPGYVMPPRGYLRVNHKEAPALKIAAIQNYGIPQITLVGWREEEVQ